VKENDLLLWLAGVVGAFFIWEILKNNTAAGPVVPVPQMPTQPPIPGVGTPESGGLLMPPNPYSIWN